MIRLARLLRPLQLTAAVLLVSACGSTKNPANAACVNGICGTAGNGGAGGNGSSGNGGAGGNGSSGNGGAGGNGSSGNGGAGGNGSSGNGGAGGNGSSGNGGAGGSGGPSCVAGANCQESWTCTPWQTAGTPKHGQASGDNAGTRTCTDACSCGTTKSKPTESVTLLPLDFDFYQCSVEPVLDKFCAQMGCHGTETGRALRIYARGKLRHAGENWTYDGCLQTNVHITSDSCIGSVECGCYLLPHSDTEWQRNYDAARAFALDATGTKLANMDNSELLKQPVRDGGLAHAGIHIFTKAGADYATIKTWLTGTGKTGPGTGCNNTAQQSN